MNHSINQSILKNNNDNKIRNYVIYFLSSLKFFHLRDRTMLNLHQLRSDQSKIRFVNLRSHWLIVQPIKKKKSFTRI